MERMNMFGNKKKDKDIAPDIFAKCDSLKTGLSEDFDSKNFSFNNMTHMFDNCTTNNDLNLSQFNTNLLHGATYFRFPEGLQEDDYNTYILNIDNHIVIFVVDTDSEECRETALAKLTSEFGVHYAWFKEEKGQKHWVLYNTENYEIKYEDEAYLVAKHAKVLYLPAGITNCYKMFSHLSSFTHLYNLEYYSKLEVDMSCAFEGCKDLKLVRMGDAFAVGFFKVNSFAHAFQGCDHLESIDITYVSLKHADFSYAFYGCLDLKDIFVLEHFNLENVSTSKYAFEFCVNLPNFDCKNVDANSTTLVLKENGGYLTRHLEHIERIHHKDYLYLLSEINNGISIPERIKNFIDNYSYEVAEGGLSLIPEDEVDLEKRFGKYLREDVKYEE